MCKVMIMTGIQDSPLALDFMRSVADNMSLGNTDGIGYSAINSQNKLFMEKWHNNKHFMNTTDVIDEATVEALKPFENRIGKLPINYTSYGEVTRDDLRTVTMHTRYATCGKTFENTHPFIENDISLIHNGVISNAFSLNLNKNSTCDSENALQLYNNMQVNYNSGAEYFQSFLDKLKGGWAFGILAKNAEGTYMLDVVREGSRLYFSKIPEIGDNCVVFATTSEIIELGCKSLGFPAREKIYLLTESNYHRFNALTGEVLSTTQLEDSLLNATSWSYSKAYGYYPTNTQSTKKDTETVDELYEYYSPDADKNLTSINDEFLLDGFFDASEPIHDRLDGYDKMFDTQYLSTFEDLPVKVRDFVERQEEKDVITFAEIILMLEAYMKTERIADLYRVFRNKRRA